MRPALTAVQDGGRICLMGCNTEAVVTIKPFDLTRRCVSLIGSCDYHSSMFPVAMQLMASLDCEAPVTDVVPLQSYEQALGRLAVERGMSYQAGKVALRINERD